MTDKVQEIF